MQSLVLKVVGWAHTNDRTSKDRNLNQKLGLKEVSPDSQVLR